MLLPHRLMPYPDSVLSLVHKRIFEKNISNNTVALSLSCCLPRQNCISRYTVYICMTLNLHTKLIIYINLCQIRAEWVYVSNESVPVMNIYGLQVPLGNSHFKIEKYRHCLILDNHIFDYNTSSSTSGNSRTFCP